MVTLQDQPRISSEDIYVSKNGSIIEAPLIVYCDYSMGGLSLSTNLH